MILDTKETVIAYRCPKCGDTMVSIVGVFSLSGDLLKLKCHCNESELFLTYTKGKDEKINIKVPCLFCGGNHSFSLSKDAFFSKDFLELSCPYTGIGICFLGNKDKVIKAIEESDKELNEMLGEYTAQDLLRSNEEETKMDKNDADVSNIVRFMLCELQDEGKIFCGCKDDGEYDFDFDTEGVTVFCHKCGCKKHYDLGSVQKADDFLALDEIILD